MFSAIAYPIKSCSLSSPSNKVSDHQKRLVLTSIDETRENDIIVRVVWIETAVDLREIQCREMI